MCFKVAARFATSDHILPVIISLYARDKQSRPLHQMAYLKRE